MLKKLVLRNFQKHKKLVIKLGAVTTIIGRTDAGKSSVIRALRWISRNRPAGSSFINRQARDCSVTLMVRNGGKVKRTRTKSKNSYSLDGETLKAFGSDVPAPVAEVLKITDANFQLQHDSPFWLSLSPGQLSRSLNEVVDLESIDHTLLILSRELRESKAEITITRERLKQARAEREEFKDAVELDRQLKAVELAEAESAELWTDVQHLTESLQRARRAIVTAKTARESSGRIETLLRAAESRERACRELREQTETLTALIGEMLDGRAYIREIGVDLATLELELSQYKECETCGRMMSSP